MTVEEYIEKYERLHVKVRKALQKYFDIDLKSVEFKLIDYSPTTTIFVIADVVVVLKGKLNYKYIATSETRDDGKLWHSNNGAVDLSTDFGIQTLAHELKHCEQWRLTPRWKYWLWYLPSLIASYASKKKYAHKFFRWEKEAAIFQQTVRLSKEEKQSFKELQKT